MSKRPMINRYAGEKHNARQELATKILLAILACPIDHKESKTVKTRVELAFQYADLVIAEGKTK